MTPFVLSILLFFWRTYGEITTYSVSPTNPSDAVSVKLYNKNSKLSLNTQPASWAIQNPSKPYSWPLHLKLSSKSFTFTPDRSCSLNITIHGSKQSINGRIFYIFSVGSSFISFAHDFDGNLIINGKKGIFIYPQCYSSLATLPTNTKIGNIYNGIRGSKSLRQKLSQTASDATSTNWDQVSTYSNANTFPVHFTLSNNIEENKSTFRFYDEYNIDIECEYDTAFPAAANQAFNLFMSTDISSNPAHNEIFELTQFDVAHDCDCTAAAAAHDVEWINKESIAEPVPYHSHNIEINKMQLSVDIEVDVPYLGDSTYNGDIYGTTSYALDLTPFDANQDKIIDANRIIYSKKSCGSISYHAHFTWIDLMQCRDSLHTYIAITQKWINFTATLYVDIISRSIANNHYLVYHLQAIDFVVPIRKSVGIKSSIKYHLNLFTITIAAVYKYKERSDIGYKLILLTESADFIVLKKPILLSYPIIPISLSRSNIEYNIVDTPINGEHCINNDALVCSQLWEIYIDDILCPSIDLSGIYSLQFNATCNNLVVESEKEYCHKYIAAYDEKVTLSSHLSWKDGICEPRLWIIQFDGSLTFYKDITMNDLQDTNDGVFVAGLDTVFVRLQVKIPLNEYIISDIRLTNVWICSIDDDFTLSVSQLRAIGGCLSPNIDDNGPFHIIQLQNNNEHFSFHAKHIIDPYDENTYKTVIRFSFIPPKSIKRDKLFIHTQVTLNVIDRNEIRSDAQQNQIRHFGASIRIKRDAPTIVNNMNIIFGGYQLDKLILFLIISLVIFVICINIFVIQRNKYMNKSYQSQTDLYDTETTASGSTMTESRVGHKRLYDMIQGLYTSHDEYKDHPIAKHNVKKKKKKRVRVQTELEIKIERKHEIQSRDNEAVDVNDVAEEKEKENKEDNEEKEKTNNNVCVAVDELETEVESDINQNKLASGRFQLFRKNDTDFTTDIQTLDELTSCTEAARDDDDKEEDDEIIMVKETKYTYASETEQEKRQRVKLIKQMIEDTEIEDTEMTEYTQYTEYSDDYDENDY